MSMTTSHKYFKKVFVSSTYEDLREYRKAVIETVQRFGWFTVAMETFVSQDELTRSRGHHFVDANLRSGTINGGRSPKKL